MRSNTSSEVSPSGSGWGCWASASRACIAARKSLPRNAISLRWSSSASAPVAKVSPRPSTLASSRSWELMRWAIVWQGLSCSPIAPSPCCPLDVHSSFMVPIAFRALRICITSRGRIRSHASLETRRSRSPTLWRRSTISSRRSGSRRSAPLCPGAR